MVINNYAGHSDLLITLSVYVYIYFDSDDAEIKI